MFNSSPRSPHPTVNPRVNAAQQLERNAIRVIQEHAAQRYVYQFKVEQAKTQIMFCLNQIYAALQLKQQQLLTQIHALHASNFQNDQSVHYLSRLTCLINQQKQDVLNHSHHNHNHHGNDNEDDALQHRFESYAQRIQNAPSHMLDFDVQFDLQQMHRLLADLDGLLVFNTAGSGSTVAGASVSLAHNLHNHAYVHNPLIDHDHEVAIEIDNHPGEPADMAMAMASVECVPVEASDELKQQPQDDQAAIGVVEDEMQFNVDMNDGDMHLSQSDEIGEVGVGVGVDDGNYRDKSDEKDVSGSTSVKKPAAYAAGSVPSDVEVLRKCSKYLAMEENRGMAWYDARAGRDKASPDKKMPHNWEPVWLDENEQFFIDSHGKTHVVMGQHEFVAKPHCEHFADLFACITKLRNGYIRWIQQVARQHKKQANQLLPTCFGSNKSKKKSKKNVGSKYMKQSGDIDAGAEKFLRKYAKKQQLAVPEVICHKNVITVNEELHGTMYDAELVFGGETFTASARKKKLARQMCFKSAMKQINKHHY